MSEYKCPQCLGAGRVWLMSYGTITEQRNDTCPLCNGSGKRKPTYEELESELKQLREYKADVENSTRMAMDETCKDEKHCTCVPLLRLEIKRLKNDLTVMTAGSEAVEEENDRLVSIKAEAEHYRRMWKEVYNQYPQASIPPTNCEVAAWVREQILDARNLKAEVERLKEAIIHIQTHLMLTHGFPCSKTESRCQLCDGVKPIIDEALKGGGE